MKNTNLADGIFQCSCFPKKPTTFMIIYLYKNNTIGIYTDVDKL